MNPARDYFDGSVLVRCTRAAAARLKPGLSRSARALWNLSGLSSFAASLRETPLRSGGIVLAVGTLTHLILLWILGRTLPVGGWLFRFGLLGVGLLGCFSRASWEEVREGSVLIRLLFRKGR